MLVSDHHRTLRIPLSGDLSRSGVVRYPLCWSGVSRDVWSFTYTGEKNRLERTPQGISMLHFTCSNIFLYNILYIWILMVCSVWYLNMSYICIWDEPLMLLMLLQLPFQDRNKSLGWPADHAPASSQSIFFFAPPRLLPPLCLPDDNGCWQSTTASHGGRLQLGVGFWNFLQTFQGFGQHADEFIKIYLILIDTSFDENLHRRHLDLIFCPVYPL